MEKLNRIKNQYIGFVNTSSIFEDASISGYENFILSDTKYLPVTLDDIEPKLMLGKRAEHFFSKSLEVNKNVTIIVENIQIQREKITLGELDFIIYEEDNQQYKHIELVYKFYLYDPKIGKDELLNWIGPNKNDSLINKLRKLKKKQFPILHSFEAKELLGNLSIDMNRITQQLCFKAQLFVPHSLVDKRFAHINPSCIKGYWLSASEIVTEKYKQFAFFMPEKQDWFTSPQVCVGWQKQTELIPDLNKYLEKKQSRLVWMKKTDGTINSLFVVWW